MKTIFITGAANGIGRATAELFWQQGWFVGAYDLDASRVMSWAAEKGERVIAGALDVTDATQWAPAIASFLAASEGRLDVLLNNAGILADGPFSDIPLEQQHAIIDVNVKGVMNGCYAAKPHLQAGARVISLCSASALYGAASVATYSASKFAVRGLTEALQVEWHADGIHVCDLMPIFVRTAMVDSMTKVHSTKTLGVHLTAETVAATVLRAATERRPQIHYLVGAQTRQLQIAARLLPEWALARIMRKLSGC